MIRERLLQLIGEHKVGQAEISEATGISQSTISRLLSGHIANPSIDVVRLLAEFFKVSVDYLIGKTDDSFRFARERQIVTFITNAIRGVDLEAYRDFLESTELADEERERARQNVLAVVNRIIEVKRELDERFPGVNIKIDWSKN